MKKLLLAAAALAALTTTAATKPADGAKLPAEVLGTWCQIGNSDTFRRGPCIGKGLQRTITVDGYKDSNNQRTCHVSTVEPTDRIGWDVTFGCRGGKPLDDGYASFLIFPMTGDRLGMRATPALPTATAARQLTGAQADALVACLVGNAAVSLHRQLQTGSKISAKAATEIASNDIKRRCGPGELSEGAGDYVYHSILAMARAWFAAED